MMKGWLYFAFVQLVSLLATVLGLFLLIPFCVLQAWTQDDSIEVGRKIDRWSWKPLNLVYGNSEDGVSGLNALIWNAEGTARVPYMPNAWAPWRAYLWSGWRNSANGLKRRLVWKGGPFIRREFYLQAGFNQDGQPVLSAGRK